MLLTTHSMEEAEELCDRVGIFINGRLAAVGGAQYLKAKYGKGYRLSITSPPEKEQNVRQFINEILPYAEILNSLAGTQNFQVPRTNVRLSEVFELIEREAKNLSIVDWGITNTTLEEVFLHIVDRSDKKPSSTSSNLPSPRVFETVERKSSRRISREESDSTSQSDDSKGKGKDLKTSSKNIEVARKTSSVNQLKENLI